jgi:hypothetical protein
MKYGWSISLFVAGAMLWSAPVAAEDETADVASALAGRGIRLRNFATGLCLSTTAETLPRTARCSTSQAQRWDLFLLANLMTRVHSRNPEQPDACLNYPPPELRIAPYAFLGPCTGPQARSSWTISNATAAQICVPNRSPMVCLQSGGRGEPILLRPASRDPRQLWQALP